MNLCCESQKSVIALPLHMSGPGIAGQHQSHSLIQRPKGLFCILYSAVDVKRSDIFLVDAVGNTLQSGDISQALKFGLVKDLFLDF